jgi:ATP-dependent Clp protease ATP-binding subunit ClpC
MSEECIAALVSAQEETSKLQQATVGCEACLVGCIEHATDAGKASNSPLDRSLRRYGITYRKAVQTLRSMYSEDNGDNEKGAGAGAGAAGWLSGFRAAKADEDRPFSPNAKRCLVQAGKLADQMGSVQVCSHHLLLALLEYQESADGSTATAAVANADGSVCHNGAWVVLHRMNVLDYDVTALDICESVLKHLKEDSETGKQSAAAAGGGDDRELVTGAGGGGGGGGRSKTPTLADCGTDLTQQAADGLLDPVYGRDKEIRSCIRTLIRRRKNNVCLIGDAGVGKTAIAEGVAQILVDPDKCPVRLRGYRLVSLELAALVAGTKYRGEFEERLQAVIKEVTDPKAPPTILFLDEIHNLVGAGAAEGGMDAANLLKPALARGEMQIIGATTVVEYRKYVEKDAALERRLQPVMVKEPSVLQTIDILKAVYVNYEKHHGVKYTPEALEAAAVLSDRYITDRFLPDKALDLLDEAGAIAQLEQSEMEMNMDDDDDDDDDDSGSNSSKDPILVTEHTMASVISEWSGIPIGKLEAGEMDRLQTLEYDMTRRVKGQGRAVRGVARAIRRARSGLRDPRRPVASFLFCGPTGTGTC